MISKCVEVCATYQPFAVANNLCILYTGYFVQNKESTI